MENDHLGDPGTDGKIILKKADMIHLAEDTVPCWTSVRKI
jgi:hypothetical protein